MRFIILTYITKNESDSSDILTNRTLVCMINEDIKKHLRSIDFHSNDCRSL